MRGSGQEAPEPEKFTCTVQFDSLAEWNDAVTLITSKYHIHLPLGGNAVVDVARGPGVGVLTLPVLGTTSALLVDLRASTYLPNAQRQGAATFVRTAAWS